VRVLVGELPWCQHVRRADDIATAILLADEFGYRLESEAVSSRPGCSCEFP